MFDAVKRMYRFLEAILFHPAEYLEGDEQIFPFEPALVHLGFIGNSRNLPLLKIDEKKRLLQQLISSDTIDETSLLKLVLAEGLYANRFYHLFGTILSTLKDSGKDFSDIQRIRHRIFRSLQLLLHPDKCIGTTVQLCNEIAQTLSAIDQSIEIVFPLGTEI